MLKVDSDLHCSHPTLLCRMDEKDGPNGTWSKLEAIRVLMLRDWYPKDDIQGRAYEAGGPQEFLVGVTFAPKSYFLCLLMAPMIFEKPGAPREIWHGGTDCYYRELLQQPDLSALAALSRDQLMHLKPEVSNAIALTPPENA